MRSEGEDSAKRDGHKHKDRRDGDALRHIKEEENARLSVGINIGDTLEVWHGSREDFHFVISPKDPNTINVLYDTYDDRIDISEHDLELSLPEGYDDKKPHGRTIKLSDPIDD